jgi:MFS family permease
MKSRLPRGAALRLCAAAFLADMALYLTMTGVPYKALALGAGPLFLGLLPVARALPYSLTTVWAGGLSEGRERLRLARITLVVAAAAALALTVVPGLPWIYLLLICIGFSLAFFWPVVQATLADLAERGGMAGNLGWFNISWSTGKATGFFAGGLLLAGFGFTALFASAALALLAVGTLVVTLPRTTGGHPVRAVPPGEGMAVAADRPHPGAKRFRTAAWVANAVAFGIGASLNHHYPNWLEVLGESEALFGTYLGLIFGSQTVTFALLARFPGWRYRPAPLLGAQVPLVLVLAVLPWLTAPALILVTAPLVGGGLGMTYFASIFYSVETPGQRGRYAGVHEALLGVGALSLPFLGGWVAEGTDRLQAPYLFAAAAGMVSLGIQAGLLGRGPRVQNS